MDFLRSGKRYLLIDAFDRQESLGKGNMPALGPDLHAEVARKFADRPQVAVVKGFLPDVLKTIPVPEKIAFLTISLGVARPTLATISELFPRVSPGGMVIIESYGHNFGPYKEIQPMMDYWAASVGHMICELPTGQGLIVKH